MVSDFAFAQEMCPGHKQGPSSPQMQEGIHGHGAHGRHQIVSRLRFDDRLPSRAEQ